MSAILGQGLLGSLVLGDDASTSGSGSGGVPPSGGGTVPTGTNPTAGNLPTTIPLKFVQIRVNGTSYYFGETQLNDNSSWTAAPGKKAGKLVAISPVRRELSKRGAFVASRCSVTLADTDRQWRTIAGSAALMGAYVALYVVDDATRRAEGTPFRFFAGQVVSHRAESGFRYTLEIEDVLGRRLAEFSKQPQLPPDVFTTSDFPDTSDEGGPIPIVCGRVSDEDDETPQGVVQLKPVGILNFQDAWGGTDTQVLACISGQGAYPANGLWEVYYNDEGTPDVRQLVPDSAWSTIAWAPGYPGWSDTGLTTDYADYNGRRYAHPLFIATSSPAADAVLRGRVFVAANIYGVAQNADGSGNYIDTPAKLLQWVLTNYVFNRYAQGSYNSLPTLDGTYSIIDTDSVAAVDAVHAARLDGGYKAGFVLGGLGSQETVFDVFQWLCEGCDVDLGINRHGQLYLSAEDNTADPVATFTAQADIEDGQYEVWTDRDGYINKLQHTWGYRYMPPVAPPATPAEGEPIPTKLPPYSEWRSGLLTTQDTDAQTTVGEIVEYTLHNYAVQDGPTALDVASRVFARALGPTGDGPRRFRFTTGWRGANVELGDVIEVSHPERVGTDAAVVDTGRVTSIETDAQRDRVTLEGYLLSDADGTYPPVENTVPPSTAPTVGAASYATTAGQAATLTFSHTVSAGSNRGLLVLCNHYDQYVAVTGVTYGGVAMTFLANLQTGSGRVHAYYMEDPPVGTANVVMSGSVARWYGAAAYNVTGSSHQVTVAGQGGNSGFQPYVTIPSDEASVVVAQAACGAPFNTGQSWGTTAPATSLFEDEPSSTSETNLAGAWTVGAPSVTVNWTLSPAGGWSAVAASIKGL